MTDAVYMDLLPTWWSREWVQERLGAFTESELERGRLLLLSGCFTEVSADGSRPVYFFGEKTSTKLRSERYSENDRQRIIGIIRQDPRWIGDLQKGVRTVSSGRSSRAPASLPRSLTMTSSRLRACCSVLRKSSAMQRRSSSQPGW